MNNYFEGMYRMYLITILGYILIHVLKISTGEEADIITIILVVGIPAIFALLSGFTKKK